MEGVFSVAYDYFTINFPSVVGFIFLLIFLFANSSVAPKIKKTFYLLIGLEFIEMLTYSLELWTTTFETLSPLRLWLSAIGYTVRPIIFFLMLMLALRNSASKYSAKLYCIPSVINAIAAFSVFFTDIVYSYTPDNLFRRGPLGYITYVVTILYLILLVITVIRSHVDRPKLESLIIFAITLVLFFGMAVEAIFAIRTVNRAAIIMVTIFYYMFFQAQIHNTTLANELLIRQQLEHTSRIDGSTGVLNKTAFMEFAQRILFTPETLPPASAGFLFLDLDHLKKINDTLGHATGDTAISDIADTVKSLCRDTDLIGRFGGDEFHILMPNITKQRFNEFLCELQSKARRIYSFGDTSVTVSASIGAVFTENVRKLTYEQLVQLADEALYDAKASGRNCHVIREI